MLSEDRKPVEGGKSSSSLHYGNPNSSPDVREIYRFTYACKQENKPDREIEQALRNKGLDAQQATTVLRVVNQALQSRDQYEQPSEDRVTFGHILSMLIVLTLLIGVNVLSAMFEWPFWIF